MRTSGIAVGAALLLVLAGTISAEDEGQATPPRPAACERPGIARAAAVVSDFGTHLDRTVEGTLTPPYHDSNLIYGYYDYRLGRGPVITLGSRTLLPGFRGYGLLFSPGYGPGLRPSSIIDLKHYNAGPWYRYFLKDYHVEPGVNYDPLRPMKRF